MKIKTYAGEFNFKEVAPTEIRLNMSLFSDIAETVKVALNRRMEKCLAALLRSKDKEIKFCDSNSIMFENGVYFSKSAYAAMDSILEKMDAGVDFESILFNATPKELCQMLKAVALYDGPVKFDNKKQAIDLLVEFYGNAMVI